MRQFVVLGHAATTDPDFPLDDLPGAAGRLDVLCRCVGAAFVLSHAIREDVRLFLVLRDRVTVRFEGAELRYLTPDERNIASLIRGALSAADEAVGHQEASATPGIYVSTRGFEAVLDGISGTLIALDEAGEPVVDGPVPTDPVFVLSDHEDFAPSEEALLAERADRRVSLGPERLHADHAIVVAHNVLDTEGFAQY